LFLDALTPRREEKEREERSINSKRLEELEVDAEVGKRKREG